MGQELDQNEEQNRDRNFEKHNHKNDNKDGKDGDGRTTPNDTGVKHRDADIENDGGAVGRNNGADKSGR